MGGAKIVVVGGCGARPIVAIPVDCAAFTTAADLATMAHAVGSALRGCDGLVDQVGAMGQGGFVSGASLRRAYKPDRVMALRYLASRWSGAGQQRRRLLKAGALRRN
jgi:hypothetical protein